MSDAHQQPGLPTSDEDAITALQFRQPHGSQPYGNFAVHAYQVFRTLRKLPPANAYRLAIAVADVAFGFTEGIAIRDSREGEEAQPPTPTLGTAQQGPPIQSSKDARGNGGGVFVDRSDGKGDEATNSLSDNRPPDCMHAYTIGGFSVVHGHAYEDFGCDYKPLHVEMAARHMMNLVHEWDGVGGEEWRGAADYQELADRAVSMSTAFVRRLASEPYPLAGGCDGDGDDLGPDNEHGCSQCEPDGPE